MTRWGARQAQQCLGRMTLEDDLQRRLGCCGVVANVQVFECAEPFRSSRIATADPFA